MRMLDDLIAAGGDVVALAKSMMVDVLDLAPKQREAWSATTGKPDLWPEVSTHAKAIAAETPWTVQDCAEALVTLAQLGWPVELTLTTPVDVWADLSGSSTAYDAARLWDALRRTGEYR